MTDEESIETDALFTRPVRTLFGKAFRHAWFRHIPKITYAVLVGRNVTTNAQTLDQLVALRGVTGPPALRVMDGTGAAAINDATAWTMEVGDWGLFSSGSIAGNGSAVLPSLASAFGEAVFEIHQLAHNLDCDATVATRTIVTSFVTGMDNPQALPLNDFARTMGSTQTANENGTMFIPRAPGLVQENDNGTIATADISPLPVLLGDSGSITGDITNGVAGDVHNLACIARRVA